MKETNNKGFSIIELLISVVVIIILGTISFLSLTIYSKNSRDTSRIASINEIKTFLNLYSLNTGSYPLPDNSSQITFSGVLLRAQGTIGDRVVMDLGEKFSKKPLDPLYKTEYIYSVTNLKNQYEILALYESEMTSYEPSMIKDNSSLLNNLYPRVDGIYNKLFIKTSNYLIPIPSILTSEPLIKGESLNLDLINIKSQIVSNGNNIPFIGTVLGQTGGLDINLSVYEGYINDKSSDIEKENLAKKIQGAYTGSVLSYYGQYKTILEKQTQDELINVVNYYIFNTEGLE